MRRLLYPALLLAHGAALAASGSGSVTAVTGAGGVAAGRAPAYASALATYHPYTDQPVQSWSEANDRVGRIGGWMAYARESHAPPAKGEVPTDGMKASPTQAGSPHAAMHGVMPKAEAPGAGMKTTPAPSDPPTGAAPPAAHKH